MLPSDNVSTLSGVGKTTATRLQKLGIETVKDLIFHFPRAFERRGEVRLLSAFSPDFSSSYLLCVATEVKSVKIRGNMVISKFRAFDDSGSVEVVFFNSPYVKDVFHIGSVFRFFGKITSSKGRLQLQNPKYEAYVEGIPLPDLVPVYPLTSGISSKQIDKLVSQAINEVVPKLTDPLPEHLRVKLSLPTLSFAIKNAHFPIDELSLIKSQERLAFDEMLAFGIGISMSAKSKSRGEGVRFSKTSLTPLTSLLPYELTDSQKQAINDIYSDTVIPKAGKVSPMARIIVGDVGCGKTVCAVAALYIAAKSGYQSTLMVPTEILATQHYNEVSTQLGALGIKVELLIGSTSKKEKNRIKNAAEIGDVDVIIGTHALIVDDFSFKNLGLIITDEQHRFGVNQRAALKEKEKRAHLLVMSATPIPRTLALTMYGDLDISRITEMPKGRQRVDTYVVGEEYRTRLNDFISKQVSFGGQCYVVCPSIDEEESDENELLTERIGSFVKAGALNLKSAVQYAEELRASLSHLRIATLHGKMKPKEKDEIMSAFSRGEIDVLVSTTVIEVGVNVPNASLMIVENAERFGLSQLHQLRGRVGRGNRKSFCVLVSNARNEKSLARLEVMRTTYDGYKIAESDLLIRGPGDFFSSNSDNNLRQSGGFEFKFASLCDSTDLFSRAFSTAKAIIEDDPELSRPEHQAIKEAVISRLNVSSSTIS